jgi:hypothetical protein
MKKTIMVMATITIEGDDLNTGFLKRIVQKIGKWFRYKHRLESDNYIVAKVEFSDSYIEIDR